MQKQREQRIIELTNIYMFTKNENKKIKCLQLINKLKTLNENDNKSFFKTCLNLFK